MKYDVLFVHPQNYGNLQTYLKLPSLELCQISAVLNQNGYSNKLVDCLLMDVTFRNWTICFQLSLLELF